MCKSFDQSSIATRCVSDEQGKHGTESASVPRFVSTNVTTEPGHLHAKPGLESVRATLLQQWILFVSVDFS